jgi:uncharacterized protein YlxW (UPF0749 family)
MQMKGFSKVWWLIVAWVIALLGIVIAMQAFPVNCQDGMPWIWDIAGGLCLIMLVGGTIWTLLVILQEGFQLATRNTEKEERTQLALIDEIKRRTWLAEKEEDLKKKQLELLEKHKETAQKFLESRWASEPEIENQLNKILETLAELKK